MNVLALDLRWTGKEISYSTFKTIGEENYNCVFTAFPPVDRYGNNPFTMEEWVDQIYQSIDDAHVFVCFGSLFVFQYGAFCAQGICERIVKRMEQGVPILLQFSWAGKDFLGEASQQVTHFFRALNILPLGKKVVSNQHRPSDQIHDYSCWFDKSYGALRDPLLFAGVSRISAHRPTLLAYDDEMIPVIDAYPPDYMYVDERDLFWSGDLGVHPSIAAVSRKYDSAQIVISAEVFTDSRTAGFGLHFPGIDENKKFASNVLALMARVAKTPEKYNLDAYELFASLERRLGKFLVSNLGADTILNNLPSKVYGNLTKYSLGRPDLSQALFSDLIRILLHHWDDLKNLFPNVSKTKIRSILNSLNTGTRLYLAHPHKAEENGVSFGEKDIEKLEEALALFQ